MYTKSIDQVQAEELEAQVRTFVPLDTLGSAASYVIHNWGEHGYRMAPAGTYGKAWTFVVRCSDGGTFVIMVDRWGNAAHPGMGETLADAYTRLP